MDRYFYEFLLSSNEITKHQQTEVPILRIKIENISVCSLIRERASTLLPTILRPAIIIPSSSS